MRLIPDARLAWRFASVQAAALLAFLSALQADVLPLLSPVFAPEVYPWVSGGLALAIVLLRLLAQQNLEGAREALAAERRKRQAEEADMRRHLLELEQGIESEFARTGERYDHREFP